MLSPLRITELGNGIIAKFPDGHQATLTLDGAACDCFARNGGTPCDHIRAALPAYERRKWILAEANRDNWGPTLYRRIGIDPQIFFPVTVNWARHGDDSFVYQEVQDGHLFVFRDGAFFWVSSKHPFGRTACSMCRTRDCSHVAEALIERKAVAEVKQEA